VSNITEQLEKFLMHFLAGTNPLHNKKPKKEKKEEDEDDKAHKAKLAAGTTIAGYKPNTDPRLTQI